MNRLEKTLIRIMALGAVLLAVFQVGRITDPVDFYLRLTGDIDYPAFQYEEYTAVSSQEGENSGSIRLEFKSEPASSVQVKQNGKTLGIIGEGISLDLKPGTVELDAAHLAYPVRVEIILNKKSHYIDLYGDSKSFTLQLKAEKSS